MIVVSGCPRSGTSLMMDMFRVALGDARIIGNQWPGEREPRDEHVAECLKYIASKDESGAVESKRDMNPNGFYEMKWTVRGIQWEFDPPAKNSVCKIVSQGLARSNPEYIDKVVMMVRHPWAVANSHGKLGVNSPIIRRNSDVANISPKSYNEVTYAVCHWLDRYKPEVLLVDYDSLIQNPAVEAQRLKEFIGEGDWGKAAGQVNPSLKRSPPTQQDDSWHWEAAEEVHKAFSKGNWDLVIAEYGNRLAGNPPEPNNQFLCTRFGSRVTETMCRSCHTNKDVRDNFRKTATRRKIDWKNEPCLYQCGMRSDRHSYTPMTIEQSVTHNHWVDKSRGLGDTIAKVTSAVGIKPCGGCKKRQESLNRAVPYKQSD